MLITNHKRKQYIHQFVEKIIEEAIENHLEQEKNSENSSNEDNDWVEIVDDETDGPKNVDDKKNGCMDVGDYIQSDTTTHTDSRQLYTQHYKGPVRAICQFGPVHSTCEITFSSVTNDLERLIKQIEQIDIQIPHHQWSKNSKKNEVEVDVDANSDSSEVVTLSSVSSMDFSSSSSDPTSSDTTSPNKSYLPLSAIIYKNDDDQVSHPTPNDREDLQSGSSSSCNGSGNDSDSSSSSSSDRDSDSPIEGMSDFEKIDAYQ